MNESDGFSVSSSLFGDQTDMEHFMNKCSICFDAQHDLCLEACRDQYCLDCFQKYIVEVVQSSWGLNITPIRCPVCIELIPKHEWTQYVPERIIEIYNKYNKPYRSYVRACPHCETEMIPCVYNLNQNQLIQPNSRLFCDIMETMLYSCYQGETHKNHPDHIAVKRWISIYKRHWSDSNHLELYKNIMQDVLKFEERHINHETKQFAHNISQELANNIYVKPETWKQLQFAHINNFSQMRCTKCQSSICLHCGYDAHQKVSCEDNMRSMLSSKAVTKEIRRTIRWKLANSRRCPNCSILINRDEGCNKVDCSYCGFCFCWVCKLSWTDGCGFYRCSNVQNELALVTSSLQTAATTTANIEEKTEIGVPNIKSIEARLITHNQQQENEMDID